MHGFSGINFRKIILENNMEQERIAKLETQVEAIKEDVAEVKQDIKEIHSRITTQTREIVDKMDDMQTRLEHKMNANAQISQEQHHEIHKQISEDVEKLDSRVNNLEKWKWYVIGGAAAIGYLFASIPNLEHIIK
jgi:chromosome segregation ATPase